MSDLLLPRPAAAVPAIVLHQAEQLLRGRFPSVCGSLCEVRFARATWFEVPRADLPCSEFWASFQVIGSGRVRLSGAIWFSAPSSSPGIPSKVKFFESVS